MSIRNSVTEGVAFMYCNTTGRAFGPPFETETELDDFLEWYGDNPDYIIDLRMLPPATLDEYVEQWTKEEEAERG
jgi:hypothetical protein